MVALGGVGLALQSSVHREPRQPLRALTPAGFSVLAAIADRICPGTGELPTAWELEVPEGVDAYLATRDPGVAEELELGLMLVENGLPSLLLDGRARPFTARSPADQDATLAGMAASRIELRRKLYKAFLALVTTTYWGHPDAYRFAGYRPADFTAFVPSPPEPPEEAP
ncbi:MAG: gluconate 2-dehydrogenase subunit 3 family protein [Myxococcota bacterium]